MKIPREFAGGLSRSARHPDPTVLLRVPVCAEGDCGLRRRAGQTDCL